MTVHKIRVIRVVFSFAFWAAIFHREWSSCINVAIVLTMYIKLCIFVAMSNIQATMCHMLYSSEIPMLISCVYRLYTPKRKLENKGGDKQSHSNEHIMRSCVNDIRVH